MDGIEIDGLDFSRIHRIMKDEQIDALVAMEPHTTALLPGLLRDGSEKITFEPNQVVMVETKKVEDPYLITSEGLQRLNTLPQKLFVV